MAEEVVVTVGSRRRKRRKAPRILRNATSTARPPPAEQEQDSALDGHGAWSAVDVDDSLAWGCKEGGFLELEELDGDVEEITDPVTGGTLFRSSRAKAGGGATQTAEGDRAEGRQTPDTASSEEPAAPASGKAQQAAEKRKKKKRKKRKKKKLGRRERLAAREAAAKAAAAVPSADEDAPRTDVSGWTDLRAQGVHLHSAIVDNLQGLGFAAPTPIQSQALPAAIVKRADVIGGAITGSGKTLAFGIPIVQQLLQDRDEDPEHAEAAPDDGADSMKALVLCPTRELSMQVCDHIKRITQGTTVRAMPIVGGMSSQKQQRLLRSRPDIVVATPGRFYELLKEGESWLRLHRLRFFVLDEADRMVEAGHFEELSEILDMLPRGDEPGAAKRQVFLFTATLHASGVDGVGRERRTLDILQKRVPFRGAPTIIDLSDSVGVEDQQGVGGGDEQQDRAVASGPAGLQECEILCESSKKDEYLYYFLCRYPGRTIVFVNAISSIRRLISLLGVLKLPVLGLHSNMQQRARLKTVDRFMASDDVVLVATDVAARGIDVKDVKYVIHYQIAKSTDTYVHRRGRTARAGKEGMSLALVGEAEVQLMRRTLRELGYDAARQLATFPVDHSYIPPLRKRLTLAKRIDEVAKKSKKEAAESEWLKQAANDLEVDLDDDENADIAREGKQRRLKLSGLQRTLDALLNVPLLPRGFSTRHLAMDSHLAGRILASAAASSNKHPLRKGNCMTVESGDGALTALGTSKRQRDAEGVGAASEVLSSTRGHNRAAKAKKKKTASKPAGGGGSMVAGVFIPG